MKDVGVEGVTQQEHGGVNCGQDDMVTRRRDGKQFIETEQAEVRRDSSDVILGLSETESSSEVVKDQQQNDAAEELRPPLPPRPSLLYATGRPTTSATTALSSIEIQTLTFPDGSRGTFTSSSKDEGSDAATDHRSPLPRSSKASSQVDDDASLLSCVPILRGNGDLESLLDEGLNSQSPAWKLLSAQAEGVNPFELSESQDVTLATFENEFEELAAVKDGNEEDTLLQWKSKLKHYLILSSAGKPIYSRHGDQNLINGYIGIIQTIMSFFQNSNDSLLGFSAGNTRFVTVTEGPLYLMAISKLKESDAQLRAQLEALYMQVLSTLTLPNLTHIFTNRPNTDLRRPLEGTDTLLSSLADTFTKGSPTALLSALECLKIRKSERHVINNTLLRAKTDKLLYGLIVAGGRLVSVARPKRHSLHPNDLQLIFNMLFEAGSVRAGGGENWIPLCLPGFNNRGYLYMYVSYLGAAEHLDGDDTEDLSNTEGSGSRQDDIAILLISADKESFFELKNMRDEVVAQLNKNGSMQVIKAAVKHGRPKVVDIAPGSSVRHFIYKSRANVQFAMPSFSPEFDDILAHRRCVKSTAFDCTMLITAQTTFSLS